MDLNFFVPFVYHRTKGWSKALTLIELLLTIAILGILSAIAVPVVTAKINDSRNNTAIADIANIESQIERFRALNGKPPNDFNEAGIVPPLDPWGHAYEYMRIEGVDPKDYKHDVRWDKHDKPLNKDYDLLSMGKDGKTDVKLWRSDAFDDLIRCNSGAFIGLASDY
jgi:general secretion pathway protein G